MNNYINISHPSYDEIHNASVDLAKRANDSFFIPDVIVGISRGGLVPAVIMSHALNIPLITIDFTSKYKNENYNINNFLPHIDGKKIIYNFTPIKKPTILLVDDIAVSGKSIYNVYTFYKEHGHEVYNAVLYYNKNINPSTKIHYCWREISEDCGWIYFPWEIQ